MKTITIHSLQAMLPMDALVGHPAFTRLMIIFPPEAPVLARDASTPREDVARASVIVFLLRIKKHDRASRLSPPGHERNYCGGRVFWAGAFPRGLGGRRTN